MSQRQYAPDPFFYWLKLLAGRALSTSESKFKTHLVLIYDGRTVDFPVRGAECERVIDAIDPRANRETGTSDTVPLPLDQGV